MIRLKNLVESLETKYRLNEAFSDDMPDWFAKRLLTTKYTPNSDWDYSRDLGGSAHYSIKKDYLSPGGKGYKKNPQAGKAPEYTQKDMYDSDQSLFQKMLDRGISLDTVKIIEGPVPISENDPRLQSPNIPIFLFDNGVVYAKGLNDEEKLGGRKSLGAYKISALLPQCKKFAYIDGNDTDNFKRSERRSQPYRNSSWSDRQGKDIDRNGKDLFARMWGNYKIDKSGYQIVPPAEKYRKQLQRLKADRIYDIMQGWEDYINNAYQELGNLISETKIVSHKNTNIPDSGARDQYNKADTIAMRLSDLAEKYTSTVIGIDRIVNDNSLNDNEKRDRLVNIIDSEISTLELYKKRLEDFSANIFNSTIDWI